MMADTAVRHLLAMMPNVSPRWAMYVLPQKPALPPPVLLVFPPLPVGMMSR
jgi:hypothetical protein